MEYIQLKEDSIFRLGIKDRNGNPKLDEKGNEICLEFDLEDIEAPLKYSKCEALIRKARQDLKLQFAVIDKKQDVKGKDLLSKNEEAKIKTMNEYYKTTEEAMDLFLGKGGTQKVFGNRRYWSMWDDLDEMLQPFLPMMQVNLNKITDKVKNKYKKEETDVLTDE